MVQELTKKRLELENAEKARMAAAISENLVGGISMSGYATNVIHLVLDDNDE